MKPQTLLASKGWEPLHGIEAREQAARLSNEEKTRMARELASNIRSTFEDSDAGRKTLELLVERYLTKPIIQPHDTQFAAGIREGRADLVRALLQQIEFAKAE